VQFLERYFGTLVDYGFTSEMEQSLDEIAEGERPWLPYLEKFYLGDEGLREQIKTKEKNIDPEQSRSIDFAHLDGLTVKIGRFGPYVVKAGAVQNQEGGRASIPEDITPGDLNQQTLTEILEVQEKGPHSLGKDPETGKDIYCLIGRFGPYVQVGDTPEDKKIKPKRASIPKGVEPKHLTLEQALRFLSLPRTLGSHPETGEPIVANVGRFGPYVVHQKDFRSLKKEDDVYSIRLERALELLSEPKKGRAKAQVLKELGAHPEDQKPVAIYEGRYGPYVKHGAINVSLPKGVSPDQVSLPEALTMLSQKKSPKTKKRR
jgi:DNA topoisomerase-1